MDDKEIRHLAALARIRIEDDEIPAIAENLQRIVQYVSEIQKVDIENVQASKTVAEELHNVMRDDASPHATGEYSEDILKNVPERAGEYVKVKKIL